jgi:hypothetical protein
VAKSEIILVRSGAPEIYGYLRFCRDLADDYPLYSSQGLLAMAFVFVFA